jgi:gliding motility-associated-like protein
METLLLPGTITVRGIFMQKCAAAFKKTVTLLCACAIFSGIANAQAPSISYGTGINTFAQNSAITPLTPTASNVAAFGYAAQAGWATAGSVPYQATGFSKNAQGDVFLLDGGTLQITKFPANGGTPVNVAPDDFFYTFILDNAGNIYGSNPLTLAITRIDAVTGAKTTLGAGDFELPYAIALGKDGTLYATDYITHKLKKIAPGTTNAVEVTTPAFELPLGIAVDAAGNLYVTDGHGLTITKIWLATDGHASQVPTGIRQPYAITIDKADNLFVGDYSNNRIVEIPADGSGERTVASNISAINGLDIDAKGNLYASCQDRTSGVIIPPTGGYFIEANLPAGLSFDSNTGTISGTPTLISSAKTYAVTAYNGTENSTANVIIKIASTNANLSALTSSGPTLSPAFNTATISYNASVGASTSSVNITPTVADAEATITYNGTSYASGLPISVSLSPGANNIPLIVTSAAGNTKTYTINIIKFVTPSISYGTGTKTFAQNSAITPLTPTASNVAAFGYAVEAGWATAGNVTHQLTGFRKNAQGDVFILDGGTLQITKFPANGGTPVNVAPDDFFYAFILDDAGNIYASNPLILAITRIDAVTGAKTTLGAGDFELPYAMALSKDGTVYATDYITHKVKKIAPGTTNAVEVTTPAFQLPLALATDAAGNLYVTDGYGLTITKVWLATDGHASQIPTGIRQPYAMAIDKADNLFVGDYSNNRIVEIPADGSSERTVASNISAINALDIDVKGNLYVSCQDRTTGVIIPPTGGYFIEANLPTGLSFDSNTGTISGTPTQTSPATTYKVTAYNSIESNSANVTIQVTPPVAKIAYNTSNTYTAATAISALAPTAANIAAPAYSNTSTTIVSGDFNNLSGAAADTAGNLYVADRTNNRVKKVTPNGTVTEIGGNFASPYDIGIDGKGNLYVAEQGASRVRKIPVNGGPTMTIDSGLSVYNLSVDVSGNVYYNSYQGSSPIYKIPANGGPRVVAAPANGATGYALAVDNAGNLYTGTISGNLYKYPAGGGARQTILTGINVLVSIKTDAEGNIYMLHAVNVPFAYVIEKYSVADGTRTMVRNIPNEESFRFGFDGKGNLYTLQNYPGQAIIKTEPTGGFYAGLLPAGLLLNNTSGVISGTPTAASNATDYKIYAYGASTTDSAKVNFTVKAPVPVISYNSPNTYAVGYAISALTPSVANAVDAPAYSSTSTTVASGFNTLSGVAADTAGNLYVADRQNNRVKKITPNGTVTEIGGSFASPYDIGIDGKGNLYVAEQGAGRVRKIPVNGGPTMTIDSGKSVYNLAVDVAGNVYYSGFASSLPIYKIPANGGPSVVAGQANGGTGYALAVDNAGNLYSGTISGNLYKHPAGGGARQLILSGITTLVSLKTDAEGNVYMIRLNNSPFAYIIEKYSVADGTRTIIRNIPGEESFRFGFDGKGNLYTLQNYPNSVILKTEPTGGFYAGSLPAGLLLNNTSGVIDGTPTEGSRATDYKVTAYNSWGAGSTLVNMAVPTTNANLAGLTPSSGILNPAFDAATTTYTATVPAEQAALTITPKAADASALVKINGIDVASGQASAAIPLNFGDNLIPVVVLASDDSTTKTYNVTVNRAPSASLGSLTVNLGSLDKPFNPDSLTYRVVLPNGTSRLEITPTALDATATIVAGGGSYSIPSGTVGYKPLQTYNNAFVMVVTASNGATKTYTLNIYVEPSTNAGLTNLVGTQGLTLNPVFDPAEHTYSANVSFDKTYFTVMATAAVNSTIIRYNNTHNRVSGQESGEIDLNVGLNTIPVIATAEDGTTTENYTLLITRDGAANAYLTGINIANATLNESFEPGVTNYTAIIDNGSLQTSFTPAPADANATIKVNGVTTTDPAYSNIYDLVVGENIFTVEVTAQNGVATKTYTVTLIRAKSPDARLTGLTANLGVYSPFEGEDEFHISVASNINSIKLTPTTANAAASIMVNGTPVTSGGETSDITLTVTTTIITIIVTAEDGATTRNYTIVADRPMDVSLSALTLSSGNLSPVFDKGTYTYTAAVSNTLAAIKVTPTVTDPLATITVNGIPVNSGTASADVQLLSGPNTIAVVVTGADGATLQIYNVTVTGYGPVPTLSYAVSGNVGLGTSINISPTGSGTAALSYGVVPTESTGSGLSKPKSVKKDMQGNLFVVDENLDQVIEFPAGGGPSINRGSGYTDPQGLAIDLDGNLYVSCRNAAGTAWQLIKIAAGTDVTTVLATGFTSVGAVAVDKSGASYTVANKFTAGGNEHSYVMKVPAGGGTPVSVFGPIEALFDVAVTSNGDIYIADGSPSTNISYLTTSQRKKLPGGSEVAGMLSLAIDASDNIYYAKGAANPGADLFEVPASDNWFKGGQPNFVSYKYNFANLIYYVTAIDDKGVLYATEPDESSIRIFKPKGGYFINKHLPMGLFFNQKTGIISGTPTELTAAQDYVITSWNENGSTSTTLNLAVAPPLPVLSYTGNHYYKTGATVNIVPATYQAVDTAVPFNVSPALPAGLSIDNTTGIISGTVTAADTATTYTITAHNANGSTAAILHLAFATKADLSTLTLSAGTLTPAFDANIFSYAVAVSNKIAEITVTPTLNDPTAHISVNGVTVASGAASAAIPLTPPGGITDIHITTTSADNAITQTYTVAVSRAPSNNAFAVLKLSPNAVLTTATGTSDVNYTASVDANTTTVSVKATPQEEHATITVNGTAVAAGVFSAPVALHLDNSPTLINTVITAQNGTMVRSYSILVVKAASSNAYLNSVTLDKGTALALETSGPATVNYSTTVPNSSIAVKVTPKAQDAGAVITVNGTVVQSGKASASITLEAGLTPTVLMVEVTAADGTSKRTYSITVKRTPATNANLSALKTSSGLLSPVFAAATTGYTASVSNGVASVTVTPTLSSTTATVKVNGVLLNSGTASQSIALAAGVATAIPVEVTAQDGTTINTYTITVIRAASNNAVLASIKLNPNSVLTTAATGPATVNYTASVDAGVNSVTVTATPRDAGASIAVNGIATANGTASAPVMLNTDNTPTVISVLVTAQNGTTTRSYSIAVNKTGSSDAYLSTLTMSEGTPLTLTTGTANATYTSTVGATLSRVRVTPKARDAAATILVNGITVLSGKQSGYISLNAAGSTPTTISIHVTAPNGVTTRSYSIIVTRQAPPVIAAITSNKNQVGLVQKPQPAIDESPEEITVHQAVSPNGDGVNDRFTIHGINAYPDNTVKVMNRNGDVIYEAKGYDNESKAFDGHASNGTLQQPGTYFYSVEYKTSTEVKRKTGYIVIKY